MIYVTYRLTAKNRYQLGNRVWATFTFFRVFTACLIFEHRIRQQIEIDDMQFGFMKGKGNTDAIFMAGQIQESFRVKGKKLYFGFVDLKKAFDRVPREVISWAMHKLGVEEWLVCLCTQVQKQSSKQFMVIEKVLR